jgi:hypothetical protein
MPEKLTLSAITDSRLSGSAEGPDTRAPKHDKKNTVDPKYMKTLKELIEATKCRKGSAAATTKRGAYWLAADPIKTRSFGGDGIGQSDADCSCELHLRHYRTAGVSAIVVSESWHQNYGTSRTYTPVDILDCTTVEYVIARLLGTTDAAGNAIYTAWGEDNLTAALTALGLPDAMPSPDDEIST